MDITTFWYFVFRTLYFTAMSLLLIVQPMLALEPQPVRDDGGGNSTSLSHTNHDIATYAFKVFLRHIQSGSCVDQSDKTKLIDCFHLYFGAAKLIPHFKWRFLHVCIVG